MAGSKQHFIPQFILRGFSVPSGKLERCTVYKKEKIYSGPTKDIGAERFFYSELSEKGEETLDDKITRYEHKISDLVIKYRSLDNKSKIDSFEAAELVSHLCIRVNHYRQSLTNAAEFMFKEMHGAFSDRDILRRLARLDQPYPGRALRNLFKEQYEKDKDKLRMNGMKYPDFEKKCYEASKKALSGDFDIQEGPIKILMDDLLSRAPDMVREAQKQTLSKNLSPQGRVEFMRTLKWSLLHVDNYELILPDSIAISRVKGQKYQPALFPANKDIEIIFIPISWNRMLVGKKKESIEIFEENMNRNFSACSWDMFISRSKNEEFSNLTQYIGEISSRYFADNLKDAFKYA